MHSEIKYGLPKLDLDRILTVLKKNESISEIILFGSRAKGNFSLGSDVDIALKGKCLNLEDILDTTLALENLFLPYKFDIVLYERINENALIEHIKRVGITLFRR